MTILVQSMPWLRSTAFAISLRAGIKSEADDRNGLAALTCEMVQRGAGKYSSRELAAIQDNLGMDRNSGVTSALVSFGAAMPADSLQEALKLYGSVVREPHLPKDQLDDARMMMLQELRAIQDEPSHRVMRRLRELRYGSRLGRSSHGTEDSILSMTGDDVQQFYDSNYHAGNSILAVAGRVEAEDIVGWAEQVFGDWKTGPLEPDFPVEPSYTHEHIDSQSSQTHIGFAFECVPYGHEDYFKMRAAIGILSDGMSSRLFDRVREQRGLCYTVAASCSSLKSAGGVFGYAGTTPERAQETLDVTLGEINGLANDMEQEELDRWKVRIESALIMEQESSASRAASLVSDFYQQGRTTTTEELESIIEGLQLDEVRDYWLQHRPQKFHFVTLGPEPLSTPSAKIV